MLARSASVLFGYFPNEFTVAAQIDSGYLEFVNFYKSKNIF